MTTAWSRLLGVLAGLTAVLSVSPGRAWAQDAPDETFVRSAAPGRRTIEFRGLTMGATFSVKVVTGQDGLRSEAFSDLDRMIRLQLDRIDRLMSTWDAGSELSRFNRSTSLEPFAISAETFEVLRWALDLSSVTGGALDVTVGPLVDAWGFGPDGPRRRPSDEEIARLREATGEGRLRLDPVARTVRKTRPGVRCDLSAVAPGYAVDRLWAELSDRGFTDFLVDVGGEVRSRGSNDEAQPWQIAVERPGASSGAIQPVVPLSNLAIATSGTYRRYREKDGERVSHILDPRTARPVAHRLASVTVIDELAVRADGLATALVVLGSREGFELAERLHLAALFIEHTDDGFVERATTRFDELTARQARATPKP
jgi:thiamine biosynthesis lipoprotein